MLIYSRDPLTQSHFLIKRFYENNFLWSRQVFAQVELFATVESFAPNSSKHPDRADCTTAKAAEKSRLKVAMRDMVSQRLWTYKRDQ